MGSVRGLIKLLNMLGTLNDEQKSDRNFFISPLIHAYNATKYETAGYSLHFLMFGWHPRLSIDAFLGTQNGLLAAEASRDSYVQKLEKRLKFAYKTAANEAQKASRRHKTRYDLKARNSVLKPGEQYLDTQKT